MPEVIDGNVLERQDHDSAAIELIIKLAQQEPAAYVEMFLPRLLTILALAEIPSDEGLRHDEIWYSRSNHEPIYVSEGSWMVSWRHLRN